MEPFAVGAAAFAVLPDTRIVALAFCLASRALDYDVINLYISAAGVIVKTNSTAGGRGAYSTT